MALPLRLMSATVIATSLGPAMTAPAQNSPFACALSLGMPYGKFNFPMDVDEDGDIDLLNVGYWLAYLPNFGNGGMGPRINLNLGIDYPSDAASADLNGDGRPDFAVIGSTTSTGPGLLRVLRSTGVAQYSTSSSHALSTPLRAVVLGDMDRDGDLDAAVASNGNVLHTFFNDGLGVFTGPGNYVVSAAMQDIAFIDADGDGDVELVCVPGANSAGVSIYSFDADGVIEPPPTTYAAPNTPDRVLVADLNGDGLDDIITASSNAIAYSILLNNGAGGFHPALAGTLIAATESIDAVDFDADGDLDLVFGSTFASTISIAENTGSGVMLPAVSMPTSGSHIAHADLNSDGLPELVGTFLVPFLTDPGSADGIVVHWNRGDGRFALRSDGVSADQATDAIATDFNGDGHLDIICITGQIVRLHHGAGNGAFGPVVQHVIDGTCNRICLADVNSDGLDDIAVTTSNQSGIVVLLATGGGQFAPPVRVISGYGWSGLSAVDIDGDDDIDFVSAVNGGVGIFRNNGDMTFAPPQIITTFINAMIATAGDVDGDGDPDIAALYYGQNSGTGPYHRLLTIYKNAGDGSFTKWQESGAGLQPNFDLLLADFDNDGDKDCLFIDAGSSLHLRSNDGNGTFSPWATGFLGYGARRLAVADLFADGQPDVLASNPTGVRASVLTLLNGQFVTAQHAMRRSLMGAAITTGDFDEDGRLDIAVAGTILFLQDDPPSLPVDGACCTPSGACVEYLSGYECSELGGSFLGPTSNCLGVDCMVPPPPIGACCLGPYQCQQLTADDCAAALGAFLGNGLTCAANTCDPVGACCTAPYVCVALTSAECAEVSGAYVGDDTTCAQGACDPLGACCVDDFVCEAITNAQCASVSGKYLGDGSSCTSAICDPIGACCLGFGQCAVMTQAQCDAAVGVYLGDATTCAAGICDAYNGRCCFSCTPAPPIAPCPNASGGTSALCIDSTEAQCAALGGVYGGDATVCAAGPCACVADVNGDLRTSAADFTVLASHFGMAPVECMLRTQGDLNCDGAVTIADFLILAGDFGCAN